MTRLYLWLYRWALDRWIARTNPPRLYARHMVSEHAALRYLERVDGYDVTALKARILTPEVHRHIAALHGMGKFVVNDVLYTVNNYKIVSIARPNPGQPIVSGLNRGSDVLRRWSF